MDLNLGKGRAAPLPASARQTVPFTPEHYREPEEHDADGAVVRESRMPETAPVYWLRLPSDLLDARVKTAGQLELRQAPPRHLYRQALREGVKELVGDEAQREEVLALLDTWDQYRRGEYEPSAEERERLSAEVTHIEAQIALHHGPLWRLYQMDAQAQAQATQVTLRVYLADWQNLDGPCEIRDGLVTPRALEHVPTADRQAIRQRLQDLAKLSPAQVKNSVSPSGSPSPAATSTATTST